MSSDMKKRKLSGRLRLAMAGDLAVAAGFGWTAFCAADGRAVARAAPAALVRKLRRVVVFVFSLLIEGPQELRYKSTTERKPRWRAALSGGLEGQFYWGGVVVSPGVPPSLPGIMPSFGRCRPRVPGGRSEQRSEEHTSELQSLRH